MLVDAKTGEPFTFEMMIVQENLDEILLPYIRNLRQLGIDANLRLVDTSQYSNRINAYDYDSFLILMPNSLNPGNEQAEYWSSESADRPGGSNFSGVKDPVVDSLVRTVIEADDRESVVTATRALDRVLKWNYYRLLAYGRSVERYTYWSKLKRPANLPPKGIGTTGEVSETMWWADPEALDTNATAPDPQSLHRTLGLSLFALFVFGMGLVAWRSVRPDRS